MKGHVKKRGSTWSFVIDVGRDPVTGKRKQKWFSGYRTKREAEKAMAEKLATVIKGTYIEPKRMSFSELLNEWLEHHVKHNTSPRTYETYRYLASVHIAPRIGNIQIVELAPYHLQRMYSNLLDSEQKNGKKLSSTTVHHIHRICYSALKWGVQMRMLQENVAESVKTPKRNKQEMKTWTKDEVATFLNVAKEDRLYPLFYVAIGTGLRRGELLGLKWEDVDFENGVLSIRRTVQRTTEGLIVKEQTKTDSSRRTVNISPATVEVLRTHKKRQTQELLRIGRRTSFVFANSVGNVLEPRKVNEVFERLTKKAGLPRIRFHDLRHTHATLLLQQGIHPKIVSERLGHSNVSMTLDLYSHVIPSMQREAAETFDRIVDQDTLVN